MNRITRRLIASAGSALVLTAALGSVSLAGADTIHRVDDDGHASATSCGGAPVVPTSIQDAVDAASDGDTIVVCPGTYVGRVVITTDDLTIIGDTPWTAVLRPEPATPAGRRGAAPAGSGIESEVRRNPLVLVDGADRVRLQWLNLVARATGGGATVAGSPGGPCRVSAMIGLVDGARDASIRANRMRSSGPGTLGPCGYQWGIIAIQGSSAFAGANLVRDFIVEGIVGVGVGTRLDVLQNSIRFWHTSVKGDLTGCWYGGGIVFADGARGTVRRNQVVGLPTALTGETPLLCPGIYTPGGGPGIIIRDNRIRNVYDGINVAGAADLTVTRNLITDLRWTGILGSPQDGLMRRNVVRRAEVGIAMSDFFTAASRAAAAGGYGTRPAGGGAAEGNRLIDNRVTGGRSIDCTDGSSGTGTLGTANTWSGNQSGGGKDDPDGICPALP